MRNTDARLVEGKTVTPAFLFAALLWAPLQQELQRMLNGEAVTLADQQEAANRVIGRQLQITSIPKRFSIATREIWELQLRLEQRNRRSVETVYQHPRFRAGYDFLLLREESGESLNGLGQWWTDFQISDKNLQEQLLEALGKTGGAKRRRRRKPTRHPAGDSGTAA
jgi:poly(A) polymerase